MCSIGCQVATGKLSHDSLLVFLCCEISRLFSLLFAMSPCKILKAAIRLTYHFINRIQKITDLTKCKDCRNATNRQTSRHRITALHARLSRKRNETFAIIKQASRRQAAGSRQTMLTIAVAIAFIFGVIAPTTTTSATTASTTTTTTTVATAAVTLLPFALCVALPSHCLPVQVHHCVAFTFLFRLNSNHTCVVAVILVIIVVVAVRLNHIIMLARLLCFG
uniref:Uncharacterized protein n=1 Tax=Glossina pallidipes TaxID=7398 RepID=A0A1B0AH37_GLOPL